MLKEFIDLVNSKIGCAYIWGGQNDEILTEEKLNQLIKIHGINHYVTSKYDARKWIGKTNPKGYYDCSGLIVFCLQYFNLIPKTVDYTASTLNSKLCSPITKEELKIGDLCFNKSSSGIVHVGVYMGNNRVLHARGTFYGIVNTQLFESFNVFGRLKFFKDEIENNKEYDIMFCKYGDKNSNTGILQMYLKELGYYTLKVDNNYGDGTKSAVIKLQTKYGLEQNGNVSYDELVKIIEEYKGIADSIDVEFNLVNDKLNSVKEFVSKI
jgi:cell wall-associated NlpC family hydrolase